MSDHSFFSMDRLVEFGLGMAVAQQMTNAMNQTLCQMQTPTASMPQNVVLNSVNNGVYYVVLDGKQAGPFSQSELSRLINEKKVTKDTFVWKPGMREWLTAENIPDVLKLVALMPPEIPQMAK